MSTDVDLKEGAGSAGPARAASRETGAARSLSVPDDHTATDHLQGASKITGVVGAGTMGAGIAQLSSKTGATTLLYDPIAEALERGLQRAKDGLAKEAAKGRISNQEAEEAAARLSTAKDIGQLADCELVIEAAPEQPQIKRELFQRLSHVVSAQCVLASNTSSLPITAVAAAASHPQRVVGMHFFNPAPIMALLEVVAGVRSSEAALALAEATGVAMGKTVIRASDGPGFLVNRCNRPFGLEALSLLAEQIADVESIDRICRLQGGFKMGPFELSDLVGVDTGFDVAESFYKLSYGEPRWRPSPLQARQIAAGLTGRKAGRGWYDYSAEGGYRPADPPPPQREVPAAAEAIVTITGESPLAQEIRDAALNAGYQVRDQIEPASETLPALIVRCELELSDGPLFAQTSGHSVAPPTMEAPSRPLASSRALAAARAPAGAPILVLCASGSLARLDRGGPALGFHVLPPFAEANLVELTRSAGSTPLAASRAQRFFATLRKHVAWVSDAPGLVLGRIVCQLINECAFALGEGVGSARDIDKGMLLGLNHPRGPLSWADEIGLDHVLSVLCALAAENDPQRYRPAPLLRKLVLEGRLGKRVGAGFFEYEATDPSAPADFR